MIIFPDGDAIFMGGRCFLFFIIGLFLSLSACSDRNGIDTSEFIVADNHSIELVAGEPDVVLPVAMVEDDRNRFWIVEMPGYMRDIDGNDESLPDGRIVILSDNDHDGKVDNRKIFLDHLENPRAVCLVYNGLLYTDGTMLKWTEIENDIPNNTVIVDSFYVIGGNIEHQPNGLLYNLDNWIYSAKSNARYRMIDNTWIKQATTFRGQWGISMDQDGRLIYNHNSAPLISDFTIPNQNLNNPFLKLSESTGKYLTDDMRIFPIQATSVNRGYLPDVLDSDGKVLHYTSACAPLIHYGYALDQKYYGSAFVCAPEANLVSNYSFDANTQSAVHQMDSQEFLVSKDETFRPVNLMTGLDGALYVVDMRKGIIQHSAYMSSYLRDNIINKGLDKVNGKGRIYRIKKNDKERVVTDYSNLNSEELILLLSHGNLQVRMFAQKTLVSKQDHSIIDQLKQITLKSNSPKARIHALWTLEGFHALTASQLNGVAQYSQNSQVNMQIIHLMKIMEATEKDYKQLFDQVTPYKSEEKNFLIASIIGQYESFDKRWLHMAKRFSMDTLVLESLVSSIAGREEYFDAKIQDIESPYLKELLKTVISNKMSNSVQSPQLFEIPFDDDRTNGLKKFRTYCTACHGFDGGGLKNLAPSLKESIFIDGEETEIASIILNGYSKNKSDYKLMMPAYKEDKNLSDQDIVDLISYLKSTFTSDWSSLKVEDVGEIRG